MEIKINACPTFLFGWTLLDQGYSSLSEDGGTSRHKSKHANSHKDIFPHTVNDYNQKSNQIYIKTTMTKEVQKKKWISSLEPPTSAAVSLYNALSFS